MLHFLVTAKYKKERKVKSLSRVRLFATPWTAAYQAPPSMGFSRQEYWNGLPFPSPKHMFKLWLLISYFYLFIFSYLIFYFMS